MVLDACRSLIPKASRRWTTAFRWAAGITISFPRVLSQEALQGCVVQHGVGEEPLQLRVSSSSVLSRLASETSIPPNLALHL
ncbi:hypothetical protein XI05_11890 [Bradyrhizobium sp. CCBAU 11357]|nr:hypothetical protein [Bradyrhizobium sp. CCBAU 11357]